jgi:cobalt-zinc-cadmium efflux system outer membrane protein
LTFALVVGASTPPVWSQAVDATALTLDECIAIALAANPLVLGVERGYDAAIARTEQARALPQPVFSYDSDLQPYPFHFGRSDESYLGLSQSVEWPARRSARVGVATAEANQASADRSVLRLDLTFDVTQAFYRLRLAEERLALAEEDLRLSESFLEQTRQKFELGDVARVEVLRAELEAAQAASALTIAQGDVDLGRAGLNYLLARPPSAPVAIRGALAQPLALPDLASLTVQAFERRPEIRRVEAVIEREHQRRREASLSLVPDLELGVARHRISGEATTWDVTLTAPVPLYFWQPKKGEVAEAEANRLAAEHEAEHVRNTIQLEVEQAWRETAIALERVRRYETGILAQARETYELFAFSYQEGEIGGLDLIAARRTLLQVRQVYAEALYDSHIAAAALDRAVGR